MSNNISIGFKTGEEIKNQKLKTRKIYQNFCPNLKNQAMKKKKKTNKYNKMKILDFKTWEINKKINSKID